MVNVLHCWEHADQSRPRTHALRLRGRRGGRGLMRDGALVGGTLIVDAVSLLGCCIEGGVTQR